MDKITSTYQDDEITFKFELVNKTKEGPSSIVIENARCTVDLSAVVGSSGNIANIRIFGVSEELISILTSNGVNLFQIGENGFNVVSVLFNNALVFKGGIYRSYCDPNNAPDYYIELEASGSVVQQTLNTNPFSFKGAISVQQALSIIGNPIGLKVTNYGVTSNLVNPHYSGDAIQQMIDICKDVNINFMIQWGDFIIWDGSIPYPKPEVSSEFGLIGYPVFQESGIRITCQYTDLLKMGGLFELKTVLPNASGEYIVSSLEIQLTQQIPNGRNIVTVTGVKQ